MGRRISGRYSVIVENYTYGVSTFQHLVGKELYQKYAIVIQDRSTKLPVCYTRYEDYLIYRRCADFAAWSGDVRELFIVCQCLNYIMVDNYKVFDVKDIRNIKVFMIERFLFDYASKPLKSGSFPSKSSVIRHRNIICQFFWMLCHEMEKRGTPMKHIKKGDLLTEHYVEVRSQDGFRKSLKKQHTYEIGVRWFGHENGLQRLNRYMPTEIIDVFIKVAEQEDPEMVFAIVLSVYMGLREGEICNVRQFTGSCYGDGAVYRTRAGEWEFLQINLCHEYSLRSDGVSTGKIKRERMQEAYGGYVRVIQKYYKKHITLIAGKDCEASKPMFTNRYRSAETGKFMAMTTGGYRKRIQRIYKKVLEYCSHSRNKELQNYYDMMTSRQMTWGAHAFRHLFTVMLVVDEKIDSETVLAHLRGDKSPESAKIYLRDKGQLEKEYRKSNDHLGRMICSGKKEGE